jgi:hypothetical protein
MIVKGGLEMFILKSHQSNCYLTGQVNSASKAEFLELGSSNFQI